MDFWLLFKDLSPFAIGGIVILVLGNGFFKAQNREADARVREADARVKQAEHEATTAKYNADDETQRSIREERLATALALHQKETALIQSQTSSTLLSIAERQQQTTNAVKLSEKHVVGSVELSASGVMTKVQELIVIALQIVTTSDSIEESNARIELALAALKANRERKEDIASAVHAAAANVSSANTPAITAAPVNPLGIVDGDTVVVTKTNEGSAAA